MRYLLLFSLMPLLFTSASWAQELSSKTKKEKEETEFSIKRNLECAQFGITPAAFQRWTVERKPDPKLMDFRKKNPFYNSTVIFPNRFPNDLVIEVSYKAALLWPKQQKVTRDHRSGQAVVFGVDNKPFSFVITHEHFYTVERVEITSLRCSQLIPPKKKCPEEGEEKAVRKGPIPLEDMAPLFPANTTPVLNTPPPSATPEPVMDDPSTGLPPQL